ncbi:hypothetical protein [Arthrobacter sp. CJ23]|uniref:hypothetical protein n=1 Tax=Arthrobacter sp. CJ23 TaxID=2972479 RepID=UPI00215CE233|nr:hypothetical protein [Arthrobacter sp. CJ23]UVJ41298.1 hypothetical protein NVV90_09220 [Arthrobacter sp. CJ23]
MTITLDPTPSLHLVAGSAAELSIQLAEAFEALLPTAMALGDHGILVTRLNDREYLVALDPSVPFGTTIERCAWDRLGSQ